MKINKNLIKKALAINFIFLLGNIALLLLFTSLFSKILGSINTSNLFYLLEFYNDNPFKKENTINIITPGIIEEQIWKINGLPPDRLVYFSYLNENYSNHIFMGVLCAIVFIVFFSLSYRKLSVKKPTEYKINNNLINKDEMLIQALSLVKKKFYFNKVKFGEKTCVSGKDLYISMQDYIKLKHMDTFFLFKIGHERFHSLVLDEYIGYIIKIISRINSILISLTFVILMHYFTFDKLDKVSLIRFISIIVFWISFVYLFYLMFKIPLFLFERGKEFLSDRFSYNLLEENKNILKEISSEAKKEKSLSLFDIINQLRRNTPHPPWKERHYHLSLNRCIKKLYRFVFFYSALIIGLLVTYLYLWDNIL